MLNIYVVTPLEAVSDRNQDAADMFKNISKLGQVGMMKWLCTNSIIASLLLAMSNIPSFQEWWYLPILNMWFAQFNSQNRTQINLVSCVSMTSQNWHNLSLESYSLCESTPVIQRLLCSQSNLSLNQINQLNIDKENRK